MYCRVKNGKVKLQLGTCLNYYINLCKDKKGIQLIITSMGTAEVTSYEEMRELISDVADLLDDIMKLYMPAAKRPVPFYPLPLWSCDLSLSATGMFIINGIFGAKFHEGILYRCSSIRE